MRCLFPSSPPSLLRLKILVALTLVGSVGAVVGVAFMFESAFQLATTRFAIEESGKLQQEYCKVWEGIKPNFRELRPKA